MPWCVVLNEHGESMTINTADIERIQEGAWRYSETPVEGADQMEGAKGTYWRWYEAGWCRLHKKAPMSGMRYYRPVVVSLSEADTRTAFNMAEAEVLLLLESLRE